MRAGTAKEIKFESIDSLFGIPKESVQHITTMVPLEKLFPYAQHPFRVLEYSEKRCFRAGIGSPACFGRL